VILNRLCAADSLLSSPNQKKDDWDKLSAGSLAGHLVECGCHVTGGNFTDWRESNAAGWENVGYPIAEVEADGSFVITKGEGTGGIVNTKTVTEQMLYEIHDPAAYVLPDVVCDWRAVQLKQVGPDRVRVAGAVGQPAPSMYKCAVTQSIGYKLGAMLVLGGRDAPQKLRAVGESLVARVQGIMAMRQIDPPAFDAVQIDVVGSEVATFGANARPEVRDKAREAILRVVVAHRNPNALLLFARELAPVALSMAPGICGGGEGRPRPQPRMRYFSCLLDKKEVPAFLTFARPSAQGTAYQPASTVEHSPPAATAQPRTVEVAAPGPIDPALQRDTVMAPLLALCIGRSGDKGDVANIGIAVRDRAHYSWVARHVTADAVAQYMQHNSDDGQTVRFELPGVGGFNFVLTRSLGTGGISSIRLDRQGKAYAQVLLEMRIPMPRAWVPAGFLEEVEEARAKL
jgi:Acyclic terpene utilisation family protein AtuA